MIVLFGIDSISSGENTLPLVIAAAFFFVFAGVAFVAYKMLMRTLKMAFRMAIVAIIMVIAVAGSLALYYGVDSKPASKKPAPTKTSK